MSPFILFAGVETERSGGGPKRDVGGFWSSDLLGVPNPPEPKKEAPPPSPALGPAPKKDPPDLSSAPPKNDPDSLPPLPNMVKSPEDPSGWGLEPAESLVGEGPKLKKFILIPMSISTNR